MRLQKRQKVHSETRNPRLLGTFLADRQIAHLSHVAVAVAFCFLHFYFIFFT